MDDDQYEDDTAAVNAAINDAIAKLVLGSAVAGLLALVFSTAGLL